jgi:hypothetical protein
MYTTHVIFLCVQNTLINYIPLMFIYQLQCILLYYYAANHKLYLIVHGADKGALFHHAIMDRVGIGADGQTTTNELKYLE